MVYVNISQMRHAGAGELSNQRDYPYDWMPPVYVYATIDEVIERASNQNYVPVVDDRNVFIGIITRRDIINAFRRQQDQQANQNEGIKVQTERIMHVV